jgi:hypothetical protein
VTAIRITDASIPDDVRRAPVGNGRLSDRVPLGTPFSVEIVEDGGLAKSATLRVEPVPQATLDLQPDGEPWNQLVLLPGRGLYGNGSNADGDRKTANKDIVRYKVWVTRPAGAPSLLCQPDWLDPDDPFEPQAIALDGTWGNLEGKTYDPGHWKPSSKLGGAFTLACTRAALAKCARWGYKPWTTATNWGGEIVPLGPLHRACARAATADYCGNGDSRTVDHTLVWIRDKYGFTDLPPYEGANAISPAWEATFDESGAACVNHVRNASLPAECRSGSHRVCEYSYEIRRLVCWNEEFYYDLVAQTSADCQTTFPQLVRVFSLPPF